jgi:hypothetical protein
MHHSFPRGVRRRLDERDRQRGGTGNGLVDQGPQRLDPTSQLLGDASQRSMCLSGLLTELADRYRKSHAASDGYGRVFREVDQYL